MNNCIDCGKKISLKAKRCNSCSLKYRQRKPELHWNFKGGLPHCKDCSKQLVNYGFDRCQSCAAKEKYKNPSNNPNFKDGRSLVINLCVDCKKEIDWKAKRCKSCMELGERNHRFIGIF